MIRRAFLGLAFTALATVSFSFAAEGAKVVPVVKEVTYVKVVGTKEILKEVYARHMDILWKDVVDQDWRTSKNESLVRERNWFENDNGLVFFSMQKISKDKYYHDSVIEVVNKMAVEGKDVSYSVVSW